MRLPEAKIKEAIVHTEMLVRQEVLLYFADCHSRDAGKWAPGLSGPADHLPDLRLQRRQLPSLPALR
jgi:hypothetical protein